MIESTPGASSICFLNLATAALLDATFKAASKSWTLTSFSINASRSRFALARIFLSAFNASSSIFNASTGRSSNDPSMMMSSSDLQRDNAT